MSRQEPEVDTTHVHGTPMSLRSLWRSAWPPNSGLFTDVVDDYEAYHEHVETGDPARADLVASWIEPGSRVLDAGCGNGVMAAALVERRGVHVEGLDVSQEAVAKTTGRGILASVQDLDADPDLPEGFDYVLLSEVLEHLRWPHRILQEAVRKAGRAVIVTLPNSGWFVYRLQMLFGHAPVQSYTHLHFWTIRDFIAFCRRLGLADPEVRAISSSRAARRMFMNRWPNLFAHQVAYRIQTSR